MPYNPNFINQFPVDLPTLSQENQMHAYDNGQPIHHSRYSFIFNERRNLSFMTAHNIDGNSLIPEGTIQRRNRFRFDPEVENRVQLDNDQGYKNNDWDRGHLVRRRSMHWGNDVAAAESADHETFFWTNIAPQHHRLHDTAWGSIEDWMLAYADQSNQKVNVFTGPVFTSMDPEIINAPEEEPFKLPAGFWKIFALPIDEHLTASGFLVWQRDYDQPEPLHFDPILEQVRITTIEYLTGLNFEDLRNADTLLYNQPVQASTELLIAAPETISLRRSAFNFQRSIVVHPTDLYISKTIVSPDIREELKHRNFSKPLQFLQK